MEDQLCPRCSAVLASHVLDNNKTLLYCAACAMQGRAPPLLSSCRNTCNVDCHDSVQLSELNNSREMSSVGDNDGHVQSDSLSYDPHYVLRCSPELVNISCQQRNLNIDSSSLVESPSHVADVATRDGSVDQLQECDAQLSSVKRLREQMEMLARDEDIPVHYGISTNDDTADADAICCPSDVNKIDTENSIMKHMAHSSDRDAAFPLSTGNDSGLVYHAAKCNNQQQSNGSPSDVSSDTAISGQCHNSTRALDWIVVALTYYCTFDTCNILPLKSCHHHLS